MPPLDIVYYQAISMVQKITKKNEEMNAVRLNHQVNQKLLVFRELEEDTNQKLAHFSELNKKVKTRQFYEDVLLKNTVKNTHTTKVNRKSSEMKSIIAQYMYRRRNSNSGSIVSPAINYHEDLFKGK